jgi:P-type E1-E2 ATPase
LKPTKVRICTDRFSQGRYVAIEQLVKGDRFHVEENEISPADGRIVSGGGTVDESSLTGEALPIIKKPGDILQSGSRLISGTLKVRADKVGDDSTLGQMMNIIQKALMTKAPLEGKTDTILQWFVPVVIALSAGTAFICLLAGLTTEESMLRAITVLVISCPCALGLAIPLARVAGISIAGAKGILVRDFSAFERAEKINAFVFDKTGTVTKGQWHLLDIIPVGPITADEALALAVGLERDADHFIATEILIQARKKNIEPVMVEAIKIEAKGITGEAEGKKLKIGSADFLTQELEDTDSLEKTGLFNEQTKHSLVYLGVDGKLGAVFIFGDHLREKILPTVQELKERGYRLVLVSGDGIQTTPLIVYKIKRKNILKLLQECLEFKH